MATRDHAVGGCIHGRHATDPEELVDAILLTAPCYQPAPGRVCDGWVSFEPAILSSPS